MKYLSWDVGIANLAYCLIEKLDQEHFKILKWGVINLKDPDMKCSYRQNKICTNKALLYSETNNNMNYYCKKHSQFHKPEPVLSGESNIENSRCVHQIHNTKTNTDKSCDKLANNWVNLPDNTVCKTHYASQTKNLLQANQLKKINKLNANKIPTNILCAKLFTILNQMPELIDNIDEVLIENQPTLKNPTMKTISTFLFSYFILKGQVDAIAQNGVNKIAHIKFICPSNKLKVSTSATDKLQNMKNNLGKPQIIPVSDSVDQIADIDSPLPASPIEDSDRKIYIMTKKMGVLFCKELIKHDKVNLALLDNAPKQDDLCDSFLQAYYYIFCRKNISPSIQSILDNLNKLSNKLDKKSIDISDLV
jgi:hypothetical protein